MRTFLGNGFAEMQPVAGYRDGAGITRLWEVADVTFVTSNYAVDEARRNLSEEAQRKRLERLLGPAR